MNLYGLIGYPLGHSFSKKYFNDKFETEGLEDCFFDLFPIASIAAFPDLLHANSSFKGLAVTIPYKQAIIPYLQKMSEEAINIGAVNCIKMEGGLLTGYNTDVIGFEKSFAPLLQPHHTQALVLGTGGASKAVQYVLKKCGIPFLLVSRVAENKSNTVAYIDVDAAMLNDYSIIINCSPVGMSPNENEKPAIPYEFISSKHFLYDLVYKPEATLFLKEGIKKGSIVKNGYDMLILQAEENWRIWNEPVVDALK